MKLYGLAKNNRLITNYHGESYVYNDLDKAKWQIEWFKARNKTDLELVELVGYKLKEIK